MFTAHNAEFDAAFLERAAPTATDVAAGARPPAVHAAAVAAPRPRPRSCPTAWPTSAPATASPSTRHHDALADAAATAAVLPHLLAAHGVTDEADLDALYLAGCAAVAP